MKKCIECGCEIYSCISDHEVCKGQDCSKCVNDICKDCCDADQQKWDDFENGGDPFIIDDMDF